MKVIRNFKYIGTAMSNTSDETEEIKARLLAANKGCYSLQTIFRSKQRYRNNKIRLYKTLIRPVLYVNDRTYSTCISKESIKNVWLNARERAVTPYME
jgi:hypothetical protein